ncbi:MAG: hypothetical protein JRI90_13960 [Deltaproteobacteria bacterium]|nr:hypothetical protein [Deltaproteobacteria bacterium]
MIKIQPVHIHEYWRMGRKGKLASNLPPHDSDDLGALSVSIGVFLTTDEGGRITAVGHVDKEEGE